jgi:hypothetical protein
MLVPAISVRFRAASAKGRKALCPEGHALARKKKSGNEPTLEQRFNAIGVATSDREVR